MLRALMLVSAILALPVHSLWADAAGQAELEAALQLIEPGRTLLTATPADLAAAVASAIDSPSNTCTPADLAASAFQPLNGAVRKDRDTSAPLVVAAAVEALLSGSAPGFAAEVGAIADSVDVVGGTNAKENLTAAGRTAVVRAALGAVSDAAVSDPALLAADQGIGQALAGDAFLEGLPDAALTLMVEGAISGIDGISGKAQIVAPQAAEAFVQGLLSSSVPNGAQPGAFAVAILRNVSKNTAVDELVAYQVGLAGDATQAALVSLAATLCKAYPSAAARVVQGVAAVTPAGFDNESARVAYIQALAAAQMNNLLPVVEGAVFVDPFYAGQFTQAVFNTVLGAARGAPLLISIAPKVASGVGAILGQDGQALAQVADVYSQFIGTGFLPPGSAAAYAIALIGGAVKSTVAPFSGAGAGAGGGQLNVGVGVSAATVTDLAAVMDALANGILTADHSSLNGKGLTAAAGQVAALAAAVAKYTRNELFVDSPGSRSQPIAAFLAGTLADDIAALGLGDNGPASPQQAIFSAIAKAIGAVTDPQVDATVKAVFQNDVFLEYPVIGPISAVETAVTNL
jgi:hypothetical protein